MRQLYSVEREFPVSLERLWRAWVSAEELQQWYCPVFLTVVPGSAESDARVGGRWAIGVDVSANGFNAYFWGEYKEVINRKLLSHTMCYSQDPLEFALRSDQPDAHLVTVEFEQVSGQGSARFSQFGDLAPEEAEAAREGIESYFDNLAKFLEENPA
jgi:uncharacterized protein YndB with AHSA1/START domain